MKKLLLTTALAIATVSTASAVDHTGFYAGVHGGYAAGNVKTSTDGKLKTKGMVAGIHGGYDHQLTDMFVIGLEGMFDINGDKKTVKNDGTTRTVKRKNSFGLGVRFGLALDNWMPFVKLGWKTSSFEAKNILNAKDKKRINALVVGLGVDTIMESGLMVGAGYEANIYKKTKIAKGSTATFKPSAHEFKIRLGYKF